MAVPVTLARGGKPIYGAPLGVLMLSARFPRIPGDMGNGQTWPFPVLSRLGAAAAPERVVLEGARGLLPEFLEAASELVRAGAEAITTNCGFLSIFQREIAAHVRVPVATSSLLQAPWVQATLPPGRRVGVVTISAATLTPAHLRSAGAPEDTPVVGVDPAGELYRVIIGGEWETLDPARAEADVVRAGRALLARHDRIGAIVLECTNMPPYAAALADAVGLPVFDAHSLVRWLYFGLRPQRWNG